MMKTLPILIAGGAAVAGNANAARCGGADVSRCQGHHSGVRRAAVIGTKTGSAAEANDCIVNNAWDAPFVRSDGSRARHAEGELLVALNSVGAAGNSAASPEGRAALAAMDEPAKQQLEEVSTRNE